MRNVFLIAAVASLMFMVTIDIAPPPQAGFQADFVPAMQG
jgi:hypothetical protein